MADINKRVTIQLTDSNIGYLDVKEGTNFPISYSCSDFRDISERKGVFSKSITLANTKNNAKLLNNYFDINIVSGTFDINKLQNCLVLEDNIPIVENAVLQLVSIKKVEKTSVYDSDIEYTVLVKERTVDFFTKLGQSKLTDLPILPMAHTFSAEYIYSTFENTYLDSFKYVMPYTNDVKYSINEWQPGIYARTYFDKMFESAGFTYEWAEINNPDVKFNNLIIPYNGDSSDLTQDQVNYSSVTATDTGFIKTTVPVSVGSVNTQSPFPYTAEIFDTEVSDPSGSYDPSTGKYTNSIYLGSGNSIAFNVSYKYDIQIVNNSGSTAYLVKDVASPYLSKFVIRPYVGLFKNENFNSISGGFKFLRDTPELLITEGASFSNGVTSIETGSKTVTISNPSNFNIGDRIQVGFPLSTGNENSIISSKWRTGTSSVSPLADVRVRLVLTDTVLNIVPSINNISYNSLINVKKYIPKEIQQSDFFKSIVTMYNLFIDVDPNSPNKLIIKSRDKFYDSGKEVDWTKKIYKEKDKNISWLSANQKKKVILTYKQDKDDVNVQYLASTNEIYGQQEFSFNNEYTKDIDKKELSFSPTPITSTIFNAVTPFINGMSPKTNIRILYDGGTFSCDSYSIYNYGTAGVTDIKKYPLFSHFDKPSNPDFDINFGTCDYYYYNTFGNKTNNNLYNYHWRRTMNQLNTGHLLTAYFDLTAVDIQSMKLNDKIRIDNAYYNINQIIDYNPTVPGPTKAELISVDSELEYTPVKIRPTIGVSPIDNVYTPIKGGGRTRIILDNVSSISDFYVVSGSGNTISGPGSVVSGSNNTISVKSNTLGDNNLVNSKSILIGDGNVVESQSIILGSNNTINDGLSNIFVIGDNIIATQSNTLYTDDISMTGTINGVPIASITSPTLEDVLINGNITNGNDIVITTTDQIRTPDSTSKLLIDSNYALLNIDDSAGTNALVGLLPTVAALGLNRPSDYGYFQITPALLTMSIFDFGSSNGYEMKLDANLGLDLKVNTAINSIIKVDSVGVYIDNNLNLVYVPTTDNTNTQVLARNVITGNVEQVDISSIDTNFANTDLTFTGNRTHDADTHNLHLTNLEHLHITGVSGNAVRLIVDAPNATDAKILSFRTNNSQRFAIIVDSAGDDIAFRNYDNTGTFTQAPIKINRTTNVITFNEAYDFPVVDGTSNQVLTTNGSGVASWQTLSAPLETIATVTTTGAISNDITLVNNSADVTMTLPTAVGIAGKKYTIKAKNGTTTTNTITIATTSSQTIDGSTTYVIRIPYESITVVSDGTSWFII